MALAPNCSPDIVGGILLMRLVKYVWFLAGSSGTLQKRRVSHEMSVIDR